MKHFYLIVALLVVLLGVAFTRSRVGNPDTQVHSIRFYPNPASSIINFEFPESIDKSGNTMLSIFNFTGKRMTEIKITNVRHTINLDEYYRGLYIFRVQDETGNIIESGKFQVVK